VVILVVLAILLLRARTLPVWFVCQKTIKLNCVFFQEKVFPIYNALTLPPLIQIHFHFIFMVADIKWLSLHTL
jgi:hypothetical protein